MSTEAKPPREPGAGAAAGAAEGAAVVDVRDLERKGLDKVKVIRAGDLDRMIRDAVAGALDADRRDHGDLLARSRRALDEQAAEAEAQRAAARRADDHLRELAAAREDLDRTAGDLTRRAEAAEAERARKREAAVALRARCEALRARLAAAEAARSASAPAAAALAARERALAAEVERAEDRAAKEGEAALRARLDDAERRRDAAIRHNQALERRLERARAEAAARRKKNLLLGKGLDIGTANLVSAMQERDGPIHHALQRNAFLQIDADPFARAMLAQLGVQYAEIDGRTIVVGDAAFEMATVLNRDTRRPMARGVLSPDEEDALPIMKLLIERLLGPPQRPGEVCCFSVPAEPIDATGNALYHEKMFQGLLARLGYDARPTIEGHAVVLAELADDEFTGIGVSCGGGMHNVCVAYKAVNVLSFSTARGGDWLDQNIAQVLGIKRSKATAIKESGVDLRAPKDRNEQAVEIFYRDLIGYTLKQIKRRFESKSDRPDFGEPVDIVFAGGTSLVGGFIEVVEDELGKLSFPIPIRRVRRAEDPLHAVAKGCLVAALTALD